jgi:hypothetical protein
MKNFGPLFRCNEPFKTFEKYLIKKYGARSAPEKNSNMLLSKVQNDQTCKNFSKP